MEQKSTPQDKLIPSGTKRHKAVHRVCKYDQYIRESNKSNCYLIRIILMEVGHSHAKCVYIGHLIVYLLKYKRVSQEKCVFVHFVFIYISI